MDKTLGLVFILSFVNFFIHCFVSANRGFVYVCVCVRDGGGGGVGVCNETLFF